MNGKKFNLVDVTPETWARLVITILTLANQVLAILGRGQIEFVESDIYQFCSLLATAIAWIWGFWKNNSFTLSAQHGDAVMKAEEAGEIEYTEKANPNGTDHFREIG